MVLFFSCEEDYYEQVSENGYEDLIPIIDVLKADEDFSDFVGLIEKSGLDKLLIKGAVYSVFAPTNQAIEDYNNQHPEKQTSTMDSIALKSFVEGHIVFGIYYQYDFNKENRLESKVRYQSRLYSKEYDQYKYVSVFSNYFFDGNNQFNLTADYQTFYNQTYHTSDSTFNVESAKVLADKMDISCSNGVIHGVDAVLLPKPNVREALRTDPRFSVYNSFIERFDTLVPIYNESVISHYEMQYWYVDEDKVSRQLVGLGYNEEDKDITVFAPTDEVLYDFFEPYLASFGGDIKNLPDDIVIQILKYNHANTVYPNRIYKENLKTPIYMNSGRFVTDPLEYIDENPIIVSNGFIYPVKKLLAPSMIASVTGKVILDPQFESFEYLMEESYMTNIISNKTYASNEFLFNNRIWYPKSWTIIAPQEVVFSDSIQKSIYDMSSSELRDLMQYLVIPDTIFLDGSTDQKFDKGTFVDNFDDGYYQTYFGTFMRKKGNTLYSSVYPDSTAQIIDRVVGSNGVIYIVDDVLYNFRKSYTLFKQMNNYRNDISIFFDEIGTGLYSDIKEELNDYNGDISLFIPTDKAIEAYNELAANDPELTTWTDMTTDEREALMRNHIIRKRFVIEGNENMELYSAVGNKIAFFKDKGQLRIKGNNENIPAAGYKTINAQASNGVLNIIDQVLVP